VVLNALGEDARGSRDGATQLNRQLTELVTGTFVRGYGAIVRAATLAETGKRMSIALDPTKGGKLAIGLPYSLIRGRVVQVSIGGGTARRMPIEGNGIVVTVPKGTKAVDVFFPTDR
jgi:hypothetical protein